jgi:hypothetical protein
VTADLVYPRDASWWDRPSVGGAHAYHWPDDPERPTFAACSSRIMLTETGGTRADLLAEPLRCRRRACASRYTATE